MLGVFVSVQALPSAGSTLLTSSPGMVMTAEVRFCELPLVFLMTYVNALPYVTSESAPICGVLGDATVLPDGYPPAALKPAAAATDVTLSVNVCACDQPPPFAPCAYIVPVMLPAPVC